ncbi:MAG: hypothetical protein J7K36_07045 [Archaeoglobaceae archaeon]|nr:hypothetical protein [Archaeoglobaceae archaeon]
MIFQEISHKSVRIYYYVTKKKRGLIDETKLKLEKKRTPSRHQIEDRTSVRMFFPKEARNAEIV